MYRFNAIPIRISAGLCVGVYGMQNNYNGKLTKNKNEIGGLTLLDFRAYYEVRVMQKACCRADRWIHVTEERAPEYIHTEMVQERHQRNPVEKCFQLTVLERQST